MENQNKRGTEFKKSVKHDANLQKNTTLYFQIGLILCLLAVYVALEYNFEQYNLPEDVATTIIPDDVMIDHRFTIEEIVVNEPKKMKTTILIEPKIVENNTKTNDETKELVNKIVKQVSKKTKVRPLNTDNLEPDEFLDVVIPVNFVEDVPIYPGCENVKNNKQRIKCMSDKLAKLVRKKFDTDIASDEGLEGRQKIYVQFKILKNGEIQLVNSRAPHKALKNEAARITTKIPKMKPGIQNGEPVDVLYTLPIVFDVQ